MTGIERLRALADEMGRGGWQGLGGELRSIAEQIEREQEPDGFCAWGEPREES